MRLALLAAMLLLPVPVQAGWLSIKNDTAVPVVIHDVPDGFRPQRTRTIRLLPGEVYREYRRTDCEKEVAVYDARHTVKPLFRGNLKWRTADSALRIERDGKHFQFAPVRPLTLTAEAAKR